MKLINIGVAGCLGRMGKELVKKSISDPRVNFVGGFEHKKHESVIAKKTFAKLDLSEFDQIEFWVRSDTTIGKGYFELTLYDSEPSLFLTPLEAFSIPALEKDVWTLVSSPMSKLESDIEVKGIGVRFSADTAQMSLNRTLWLDEIKALGLSPICSNASLPLS